MLGVTQLRLGDHNYTHQRLAAARAAYLAAACVRLRLATSAATAAAASGPPHAAAAAAARMREAPALMGCDTLPLPLPALVKQPVRVRALPVTRPQAPGPAHACVTGGDDAEAGQRSRRQAAHAALVKARVELAAALVKVRMWCMHAGEGHPCHHGPCQAGGWNAPALPCHAG